MPFLRKALLKKLAQITVERGGGRLEWACLDWNQPSIDFYLAAGAKPMDEWTTYRVAGEDLKRNAEKNKRPARNCSRVAFTVCKKKHGLKGDVLILLHASPTVPISN